jgi:hypothetical protein
MATRKKVETPEPEPAEEPHEAGLGTPSEPVPIGNPGLGTPDPPEAPRAELDLDDLAERVAERVTRRIRPPDPPPDPPQPKQKDERPRRRGWRDWILG